MDDKFVDTNKLPKNEAKMNKGTVRGSSQFM